jgi:3-hydroxyisobutyrate dehydrogenase
MGSLMAHRLADSGIAVSVADVSPEAVSPFQARGLAVAAAGAALQGDIVITMLPGDTQVREALLGPQGACITLRRKIVIDMSTVSPASTTRLSADLALYGCMLVDAPVSGGMAGAREGSLTAMVGGDTESLTQCRALLEVMCAKIFHVGPVGSGHVVKALNNYLSAATLWTATEALVIGTQLGLDPATMVEVWNGGSGKSHATEVKLPRHVLTRSFDFGQSLALFCKDIGIAADLAHQAQVPAPALDAVLAMWRGARDGVGPAEDITAIARLLEANAHRDA